MPCKGSGTPEQQAAMKAQIEVSTKVNRYGGKTPSGTTAVDAKKGIEDHKKVNVRQLTKLHKRAYKPSFFVYN